MMQLISKSEKKKEKKMFLAHFDTLKKKKKKIGNASFGRYYLIQCHDIFAQHGFLSLRKKVILRPRA